MINKPIAVVGIYLLMHQIVSSAAITTCVQDAASFQAAMATAQVASTDLFDIRLVEAGSPYVVGDSVAELISNIQISGGWNASCSTRAVRPGNTVIDLDGGVLSWFSAYDADDISVALDGVSVQNGRYIAVSAGYESPLSPDDPGSIAIANTIMSGIGDPSSDDRAIYFFAASDGIHITNSRFDRIQTTDPCAVTMEVSGVGDADFDFSTFQLSGQAKLCFIASSDTVIGRIRNSILWGENPNVPSFDGAFGYSGYALDITVDHSVTNGLYEGDGAVHFVGNVDADPQWTNPAGFDYHLQPSSPAVNAGVADVAVQHDIDGNYRYTAGTADIGAYESPYGPASTYVVTSAADTVSNPSTSTLRGAMIAAAGLQNAVNIRFNLPCGTTIGLVAPLPPITSNLFVDGYTGEPGAVPNTDPDKDDAVRCIALKPAAGISIPHAFDVPATIGAQPNDAAIFSVRGLAFGGFANSVIQLDGGHDHAIGGNQFGGPFANTTLAAPLIGVIATAGVGHLSIGGSDASDRNVFVSDGSPGSVGVIFNDDVVSSVADCRIENNLIGYEPDGVTEAGFGLMGIYMDSSGCYAHRNRIAVGPDAEGAIEVAGDANWVKGNIVGVGVDGASLFSGGVGILVTGNDNQIGGGEWGVVDGNAINAMLGGGIVVHNGLSNALRGNLVLRDNLPGEPLAIDLGADGEDQNDDGDADGGPNGHQNRPAVVAAQPGDPADARKLLVDVVLGGVSGEYQVDFYEASSCVSPTAGRAVSYLGSSALTVADGTTFARSTLPVTLAEAPGGEATYLSATVTGPQGTSELGPCAASDTIFKHGLE
jgi:hypothetical protein